jgi:hypothetical protein
MLAGKKFSTNEEVIVKTEAYFEAISKSYHKNGIEKLYEPYNHSITLERKYIELFYQNNVFYNVSLRTSQPALLHIFIPWTIE